MARHKFDYWMLTEMAEILKQEVQRREQDSLRSLHRAGLDKDQEEIRKILDMKSWNRFEPLGKVCLIQQKIQQMKDEYAQDIYPGDQDMILD